MAASELRSLSFRLRSLYLLMHRSAFAMVVVTLSDPAGRREKQFRATTAAAFLREARAAFGAGTVEGPDHITLTDEAGDLVDGTYVWTATQGE